MNKIKLANNVAIPQLGLGVWKASNAETEQAVEWAIQADYRMIDTAAAYHNERAVGQGIKNSCISREELFITTKLWNADQGYKETFEAFEKSLEELSLDYVDLYLIHWPVADKFIDSCRAMEEIYASGRAKAIGVSNFHQSHLEELL